MACNYAVAGIMGLGKTSLVIEPLLGAMLDPLVELDGYAMAFNADFDPMAPRLRVLVTGDEDETVGAAIDALGALRSADASFDEPTPVVRRALAARKKSGPSIASPPEAQERDLLADVAEVLGGEEVPAANCPVRTSTESADPTAGRGTS